MASIYVKLNFGRDAGRVQEMRFDEAKELIANGRAQRVIFDSRDAQALTAAIEPAAPSPIAPPVQAQSRTNQTRRDHKKLRKAIAAKMRRPN